MIAINLVRCASPWVDKAISCLGSIEICYLYHHFIMVDDVHHVDEHGVPRKCDGEPAMIFECGNTIPEVMTEVQTSVTGRPIQRLLQFSWFLPRFVLFNKAKFSTHPLADYGDTPHIYRLLAKQTPEERERIVAEALHKEKNHKNYNAFWNNCEHTCNQIRKGDNTSEQITFLLWVLFRVLLGVVGLTVLRFHQDLISFAGACYWFACSDSQGSSPRWAVMSAYHLFTSVPVALQAMISYALLMRSVWLQYLDGLIDRHEYYHLLGKELGRAVVVGGWTVAAIAVTPHVVSNNGLRFVACASAYAASDVVYNCLAHAVMRLVLIPTWGRVWLLGPPMPEKEKSS